MATEKTLPPKALLSDRLDAALVRDLASVPQVRHVLTDRSDSSLIVWIAVDDPTPEVRRRIYQKELELISGFPEVEFDFNLVPSLARSAADFATRTQLVYSR